MLLACGFAMVATMIAPSDKTVMGNLITSAVAFVVPLVF